jgi:NarL family two-component system response regulator LiaR
VSPGKTHHAAGDPASFGETRPLKIAIADDHPFYRGRLAASLRDRGFEVVGEVGNGRDAIEISAIAAPDVILMDLKMPVLSGFEATRRLFELTPRRNILAISASALEDEIADTILWGANGHFSKDRPLQELIWAIEAIAAGRPLISPGIARVLLRRVRGEDPERSLAGAPLERREREVLACLAQGHSVPQMAIVLLASTEEISDDIEVILFKLRIEERIREILQEAKNSPDG